MGWMFVDDMGRGKAETAHLILDEFAWIWCEVMHRGFQSPESADVPFSDGSCWD